MEAKNKNNFLDYIATIYEEDVKGTKDADRYEKDVKGTQTDEVNIRLDKINKCRSYFRNKFLDYVVTKNEKDVKATKDVGRYKKDVRGTQTDDFHNQYDKSNEYCSSFTVHGLSRALTGNFYEKVFWGLIVISSLSVIAALAWNLAKKYQKNDVYIKFYSKEYSKIEMPVLTICPRSIDKQSICNLTKDCLDQGLDNITVTSMLNTKNSSFEWTNDKISVIVINESRRSVKTGVQLRDYIKGTYYQCIRVNLNFFDITSSTSNGIHVYTVYPKKYIELFVHDEKEQYPFFQTKPNFIEALESDEINIEFIQYKRLKHPFASNCSVTMKDMIFPDFYSKQKCVESIKCVNSFNVCGDTYGFCKTFLNNSLNKKYAKNISGFDSDNLKSCLKLEYEKIYDNECALACDENIYKIVMSYTTHCNWLSKDAREIYINYPLVPYYHVFEEAPLYPFEQFLSEFGGLIGLFTGGSAISIIEILIFLCLILFKNILSKYNQKRPEQK